MNFFFENIYTVILVPFWIALIVFFGQLFGIFNSKKVVNTITLASSIYCLIFTLVSFIKTVLVKGFVYEDEIPFITVADYNFNIGVYFDGVSAWLLLLTAIIVLLVQIYSFAYMKDDKGYIRYFGLLNLFSFSMFGLILSQNLVQLYIFWELVGVSSYLLIGFWFNESAVSVAAKKSFIINRIGDFSLLAGIVLFSGIIYSTLGSSIFVSLPLAQIPYLSAHLFGYTSDEMFILICILLLGGAIAKSAQFPLHSWLIDAMKGPTPVSALIHSATMVAAGVYLLIRLYPLFSLSEEILNLIAIIGIITAISCSISAICQSDIKKVLAYSTNAQLGLMFLAVGCCSTTIALFHLTTHAFAKAMLFLASGTVIYALNSSQSLSMTGGLRKKLPICAYSFIVGIVSLSGFLFSGFSSKEMMLSSLIDSKHYIYAVLFILIAFLTVYYLFRLYVHIFEGEPKSDITLRKVPLLLNIVPVVFSVFVILLWCVLPKSGNFIVASINYFVGILAALLLYFAFKYNKLFDKLKWLRSLSYNAFYVEDFVSFVVNIFDNICKFIVNVERVIFNGIVYIFALFARLFALLLSKFQTGNIQTYLSYSLLIIMLSFGGVMVVYSLIIYLSEVQ